VKELLPIYPDGLLSARDARDVAKAEDARANFILHYASTVSIFAMDPRAVEHITCLFTAQLKRQWSSDWILSEVPDLYKAARS